MSEKSELKPCFCGSSDVCIGRGTEDREGIPIFAYCGECGIQGPFVYTHERDETIWPALIASKSGWNTRAREAELEARVKLLEGLLDMLDDAPELNPSNYDHNQVCELNAIVCEVCVARKALCGASGEGE